MSTGELNTEKGRGLQSESAESCMQHVGEEERKRKVIDIDKAKKITREVKTNKCKELTCSNIDRTRKRMRC